MSYPTYLKPYATEIKVGDKVIKIEIGKFSEQVSAAVLATCGETVVHTTVALGRKVDLGYFPLSVEFAEKLFASGIIKGSQWVKRDGRPTDDAILKARVIDRTMRPMFPEGITNEVQIINTVLSFDGDNDPDMVGLVASGVALAVSEIPFDGPVAGVRVGYSKADSKYLINPTLEETKAGDLDLIVSGTAESIVMVEAGANEIDEPTMLGAFEAAQAAIKSICKDIAKIAKEAGKDKVDLVGEKTIEVGDKLSSEDLKKMITKNFAKQIREIVEKEGRLEEVETEDMTLKMLEHFNVGKSEDAADLVTAEDIKNVLYDLTAAEARRMILEEGVRPDGRKTTEVRPIWCEVDLLPRTHGSAMFKRGATQAVTITTLGSPSLGQSIESLEGTNVKHYMHHYNMPPYASGEAGRFGAPKRREIGHGALAERALLPMIPSQEVFPYAIHVVTEIMSSNGSTSMASVCGSTMSLMTAGVPLKAPVAGIAMGLITDGKGKFAVLSDIQGVEDHIGDMDFKVAGTDDGITALQMDIKIKGIPFEVLKQALAQAKEGRTHIKGKMMETINEPRTTISQYAPKIKQVTIPQDRIGELIGPGGKNIKAIIEQFGAEIEVDEDEEQQVGIVNISSPDQEKIDAAANHITNMMRTVEIGDEFDGPVVRIEPYGVFVNILPGKDGLVHVSAMSTEYLDDPSSVVQMGEVVHVRVSGIQDDGKIKLSMLTAEQDAAREAQQQERRGGGDDRRGGGGRGFGGGRPPFRGGRGGDRGGYRGRGGNDRRGGRDY